MKKLLLIIAIIVTMTLTLVGCASAPVAGRAWADYEVLTYDVLEDGQKIGTMTATIEVLSGEQTFTVGSDLETKYDLGSGSSGKRLTQVVTIGGQVAMQSQALVKDWKTLASYKTVDYKDTAYTVSTVYQGKYVKYTKTAEDGTPVEGSIKVGSTGYVDNEFVYTYVRAYPQVDSSFSKTITTIDYENMQKTSVSISTTTQDVDKIAFEGEERACAKMVLQHSSSPVGKGITARYFVRDAYNKASLANSYYDSYRIPAEIVENNLTYQLVNVSIV